MKSDPSKKNNFSELERISEQTPSPVQEESEVLFIAEILQKFKHGNFEFSMEQMEFVKNLGENALPVLIQALKEKSVRVRIGSAWLLSEIGPKARPSIPILLKLLKDPNEELRNSVVLALSKIGESTPEIISALEEALSDKAPRIRSIASEALKKMNKQNNSLLAKKSQTSLKKIQRLSSITPVPEVLKKNHSSSQIRKLTSGEYKTPIPEVLKKNHSSSQIRKLTSGEYKTIGEQEEKIKNDGAMIFMGGLSFFILFLLFSFLAGSNNTEKTNLLNEERGFTEENDSLKSTLEQKNSTEFLLTKKLLIPPLWIDEQETEQLDEKSLVFARVSQLLEKTREGKFQENILFLGEAKQELEFFKEKILENSKESLECNIYIKEIDRFIAQERSEKESLKENASTKKKTGGQKERNALIENNFRLLLSELEKLTVQSKESQAKKDYKNALIRVENALGILEEGAGDFESTEFEEEIKENRAKLKEQKKFFEGEILFWEKNSGRSEESYLTDLKKAFPNATIKFSEKEQSFLVSYSFTKTGELNDFVSLDDLASGEFSQDKEGLSFKGTIRLKSLCPFKEYSILLNLPIQFTEMEDFGMLVYESESEYVGFFVRHPKKSISFLKVFKSAISNSAYLAQSIPLNSYLNNNKNNQIEINCKQNMLIFKGNKSAEFVIKEDFQKVIGFYTKNKKASKSRIKKLEIIGKF